MGNGDESFKTIGYLFHRFQQALQILNNIQQPPSCQDTEEACTKYEEEIEEGNRELQKIAQEFYLAIAGKPDIPDYVYKDTQLGKLRFRLANNRIKHGTDYAIVLKYGKYHLLCETTWNKPILEEAKKLNITFDTITTYDTRN